MDRMSKGTVFIKCLSKQHNCFSCCVTLLNAQREVICQDCTSPRGEVRFAVPTRGTYHIRVEAEEGMSPRVSHRWVLLCPERQYSMTFVFDLAFFPKRFPQRNFYLTDQNYDGLPIVKGEFHLWRDLM